MAFTKYKKTYSGRKKVCEFCENGTEYIDFKNTDGLKRYLNPTSQIKPRVATGACAKHQRKISTAIKRARYMALIPYSVIRIRVQR